MPQKPSNRIDFSLKGGELNESIQKVIELVRSSKRPKVNVLPPDKARLEFERANRALDFKSLPLVSASDFEATFQGCTLAFRDYRFGVLTSPMPVILFLHGGGWTFGSISTHDALCRQLSYHTGFRVLSLDYRLAPEHPFPAALDDATAAYEWLLCQSDTKRIVVAGDSAGGNLALALSLNAQRKNLAPPSGQILLYPVVSLSHQDLAEPSLQTGYLMERDLLDWCISNYLSGACRDREDPLVSPAYMESTEKMPSTILLTAGFDLAAPAAIAFSKRLSESGVHIAHLHYPDTVHGFLQLAAVSSQSMQAIERIAATLKLPEFGAIET